MGSFKTQKMQKLVLASLAGVLFANAIANQSSTQISATTETEIQAEWGGFNKIAKKAKKAAKKAKK